MTNRPARCPASRPRADTEIAAIVVGGVNPLASSGSATRAPSVAETLPMPSSRPNAERLRDRQIGEAARGVIGVERGAGRGLEIVGALRAAGAEAVRSLHAEPRRGVARRRGQILRMHRQRRNKQRGGQKARPNDARCCSGSHDHSQFSRFLCPELAQTAWNRFYWKNSLIPMPLAGQMAAAAGFTRGAPFWPRSHLFPRNFIFLSGPNCGRRSFPCAPSRPILRRARRHIASKTRVNALAGGTGTGGLKQQWAQSISAHGSRASRTRHC